MRVVTELLAGTPYARTNLLRGAWVFFGDICLSFDEISKGRLGPLNSQRSRPNS